MYDLEFGNRLEYFTDANCTNKLSLEDARKDNTDFFNQLALSQFTCKPTQITYEDDSYEDLQYTFVAECRAKTFSMNLVTDCEA